MFPVARRLRSVLSTHCPGRCLYWNKKGASEWEKRILKYLRCLWGLYNQSVAGGHSNHSAAPTPSWYNIPARSSSPPAGGLQWIGDDLPDRSTANADSGGPSVMPHSETPTPSAAQHQGFSNRAPNPPQTK